ncbi:MAG: glycosyltransferase family 39 protein [Anaerolineales bacterium]|nr:glycosyltransferase family 39 protein [Anaerolineales bacterium]
MTDETPQQTPENEPTVLDLYKSVTKDWTSFFNFIRSLWDARRRAELNRALADEVARQIIEEPQPEEPARADHFPWRATLALLTALAAQFSLEPQYRQAALGLALYVFAIGFALWAHYNDEWHLPALPVFKQTPDDLSTRLIPFLLSIILALIAFLDFGGDQFTLRNVALWVLSLAFLFYGLWLKTPKAIQESTPETRRKKIIWNLLILAVFGVALFFRLYRTDSLPAEPFSDHAEKILDVYDISQGNYNIFFPRNTGREAIQMYWTLLVANIFGAGLSFLSLKLGTALLGILTLPFIYLLGKEFGNERVGLFALFLFGVSYWNNVISRIGLRFPLYPLFTAPTLYYLIRGLRTRNRNDFLLSGLFLGFGLHGYSPFRIVPILVVIAFIIYVLHEKTKETRRQSLWQLIIVAGTSAFAFIPLLRYWVSHPDIFGYRAFSRLGAVEAPLPGSAWQIFFSNLHKGLLMFNWDDGEIWVNSMPHRPALDFVTGALFVIGVALLIARYARGRDWRDLFLLVSIPILILPSALSLAFPGENPALNRAGGAAVAVILVGALALEGIASALSADKKRAVVAYGIVAALFALSAQQNYNIVFNQFDKNFRAGAWNTSEMGRVVSQFKKEYGETDTVWIVPFPHWVDTRLPGVWAGIPNRDFALWRENLPETQGVPAPKMFIFWNEDMETQTVLMTLYPNGTLSRYASSYPGKDFMIFMVTK